VATILTNYEDKIITLFRVWGGTCPLCAPMDPPLLNPLWGKIQLAHMPMRSIGWIPVAHKYNLVLFYVHQTLKPLNGLNVYYVKRFGMYYFFTCFVFCCCFYHYWWI